MDEKSKEFHCGVDVTYNTWVYVEAENETEAEKQAIKQVAEDCPDHFAYANVHAIYDEKE